MRKLVVSEFVSLDFPVVVGKGRKLLESGAENKPLTLVDTQTFSTGVVVLTYAPRRDGS
jgi:dihydrofolate reductase